MQQASTRYSPGGMPSILKLPSEFHCGGRIGNPMPGLKTKGRSETFARTPAGSALLSSVIRPEMDTGGSNVTTAPSTSLPRTSTDAVAIGGIGGVTWLEPAIRLQLGPN